MNNHPLAMLPLLDFTELTISPGEGMRFGRPAPGQLSIRARVRNRTDSTQLETRFGATLPDHWAHMPEESRASWLRSQMMNFAAHEIDEMLFVSGLGKDPHKTTAQIETMQLTGKVSL